MSYPEGRGPVPQPEMKEGTVASGVLEPIALGRVTETKPGTDTTEFWLTILINLILYVQQGVGAIFGDAPVPAPVTMGLTFLSVIAYAISRGIAKRGVGYDPAVDPQLNP